LPEAQVNEKRLVDSTTILEKIEPLKMDPLAVSVTSLDPTPQLPELRVTYVDPKSLDCLAKTIYFEAKSEPLTGQIAVGHVVLNRTKDPRFPNTVCGVVTQTTKGKTSWSCQFHWYCDGKSDVIKDQKTYAKTLEVARLVLTEATENPVGNCLFFHATYVKQQKKHYSTRMKVGNHVFYT
jgi:spore germination cell wall hydrolase CwlJ-like protein